jgi:hypothetical protein
LVTAEVILVPGQRATACDEPSGASPRPHGPMKAAGTFTPRAEASRNVSMTVLSVRTWAAMSICFVASRIKATSILSRSSPDP